MIDFKTADYFFDQSLVPDSYPNYYNLRAGCPARPTTPLSVIAITEPDTFDISRNTASHLTFDRGLGVNPARLKWRVALDGLLSRRPDRNIDHAAARPAPASTVPGWDYLHMITA